MRHKSAIAVILVLSATAVMGLARLMRPTLDSVPSPGPEWTSPCREIAYARELGRRSESEHAAVA